MLRLPPSRHSSRLWPTPGRRTKDARRDDAARSRIMYMKQRQLPLSEIALLLAIPSSRRSPAPSAAGPGKAPRTLRADLHSHHRQCFQRFRQDLAAIDDDRSGR